MGLVLAAVAPRATAEEMVWKQLASIPDRVGFAGSFAGVCDGGLLVAGGANFPDKPPWEGGTKTWHARAFLLDRLAGKWTEVGDLPAPRGYGASVNLSMGLVLIGGSDPRGHTDEVLSVNYAEGKLRTRVLEHARLPHPMANLCAARVGDQVYVAGGIETPSATKALSTFMVCNPRAPGGWSKLPTWPGRERMLATAAARGKAFYLFGGAALEAGPDGAPVRTWLRDAYCYHPEIGWKRLADLPRPVVAAPSPAPIERGRVLLLGGDDGAQLKTPPGEHKGFPREVLAYDLARDRWETLSEKLPFSLVTTPTVEFQGQVVIPGGEIRPGTRSIEVWAGPLETNSKKKAP